MEAEITLEYKNEKTAEAVARAISPDNFKTPPDLSVKTTWNLDKVLTKVICKGRLATFIATIDDLLSCTSVAEKALEAVNTTKREATGRSDSKAKPVAKNQENDSRQ